jgi:hypothetical protein
MQPAAHEDDQTVPGENASTAAPELPPDSKLTDVKKMI